MRKRIPHFFYSYLNVDGNREFLLLFAIGTRYKGLFMDTIDVKSVNLYKIKFGSEVTNNYICG